MKLCKVCERYKLTSTGADQHRSTFRAHPGVSLQLTGVFFMVLQSSRRASRVASVVLSA